MKIHRALSQIAEIHRHLTKTEVYRGCRSFPVALTGVFALLGGFLMPWVVPSQSPAAFALFWCAIAVVSFGFVMAEVARDYFRRTEETLRRTTRKVCEQFVPCIAAGTAVTAAILASDGGYVPLLPGMWAIIYSLGLFSARPYLPRAIGWVALFYLLSGVVLLLWKSTGTGPMALRMAGTFGPGQLLAALVLYWDLERKTDEEGD